MINGELGKSNLWAGQWHCPRNDCAVCKGRAWIAEETEQLRDRPKEHPRLAKSKTKALPICTKEGVVYTIECTTCRKEGRKRIYWGESSRSGYQRGCEHEKEISDGIAMH